MKARERRAACNEVIGSWTSLTSVQEGASLLPPPSTPTTKLMNDFRTADYTALLALHPAPAAQADLRRKLAALAPRLAASQKRETDEMLGKLKGLGNSILGAHCLYPPSLLPPSTPSPATNAACTHTGNFGLSTDNFKFEPNGAGGYSLNFQQ